MLQNRRMQPREADGWMSAGILLCRILVGLGEGVAPTSATDMVASVLDKKERSRSIGFIFSGLHVGSLAGLLVAPVLIERFGWPAVSRAVTDHLCDSMAPCIAMWFCVSALAGRRRAPYHTVTDQHCDGMVY